MRLCTFYKSIPFWSRLSRLFRLYTCFYIITDISLAFRNNYVALSIAIATWMAFFTKCILKTFRCGYKVILSVDKQLGCMLCLPIVAEWHTPIGFSDYSPSYRNSITVTSLITFQKIAYTTLNWLEIYIYRLTSMLMQDYSKAWKRFNDSKRDLIKTMLLSGYNFSSH